MGCFADCKSAIDETPSSGLSEVDRDALYARIRAVHARAVYVICNIALTILLYLFNGSFLNGYIQNGQFSQIIIFHSAQLLAIIAYFTTSLYNPGYIKPVSNASAGNEPEIWNRDIVIDQSDLNNAPFGFCWRCNFIRPIRSKHCYDCDRCVGKFDHHCSKVGNCIGGNNHRYFLTFLFFQSIVILWCFHLSTTDLYAKCHHIIWNLNNPISSSNNDGYKTIMRFINWGTAFRLLFFVSMLFAMLFVLGLFWFHCFLSSTNQTTYEIVKPHILEKWIREESKRKRKMQHPKNRDFAAVDMSNDARTDDDGDDHGLLRTVDGKYQRSRWNNDMISFDEGIVKNLWRFWTAQMKNEWITPFKCRKQ